MMGDNRDNSIDSRFEETGMVPFENFVGRAETIFFSISADSAPWKLWTWPTDLRLERFFSPL
jgi:signal peptidase I